MGGGDGKCIDQIDIRCYNTVIVTYKPGLTGRIALDGSDDLEELLLSLDTVTTRVVDLQTWHTTIRPGIYFKKSDCSKITPALWCYKEGYNPETHDNPSSLMATGSLFLFIGALSRRNNTPNAPSTYLCVLLWHRPWCQHSKVQPMRAK